MWNIDPKIPIAPRTKTEALGSRDAAVLEPAAALRPPRLHGGPCARSPPLRFHLWGTFLARVLGHWLLEVGRARARARCSPGRAA